MEILERVKNIHEKEKETKKIFDGGFGAWKSFILRSNGWEDRLFGETIHQMGSMVDGSYTARFFIEKCRIFEIDAMLEIAEIPTGKIQQIKDKPGFYNVDNFSDIMSGFLTGFGKYFQSAPTFVEQFRSMEMALKTNNPCLRKLIKDLVSKVATSEVIDGQTDMTKAMASLYDVDPSRISCDYRNKFNGPATTQEIHFLLDGKDIAALSIDIVICARLSLWPQEAEEWVNRKHRKWPPVELVGDIMKEHKVYLVSKPSLETSEEESNDWRLTFLAENQLIQAHSPEMRLTYFIFKILFYTYFKKEEIDGKSLPSYLAKTTMHWLCEELNPECWTEENTVHNVKLLLKKLCGFLDDGNVPNYFIPAINLLANIPDMLVEYAKAMDKTKLFADPIGCLPNETCFDKVNDDLEFFQKMWVDWDTCYSGWLQDFLLQRQNSTFRFVDDDLD